MPTATKPRTPVVPEPFDPLRQDLTWLLHGDYRGDLGVRAIAYREHLDGGPLTTTMDERMIDAATRFKRLTRRWAALAPEHQRTLTTYYGPASVRRVLPEWGSLGGLVLSRPLAHAEHRRSGTTKHVVTWLARLPVRPAMAGTYRKIRDDAQTALDSARAAWRATGRRARWS